MSYSIGMAEFRFRDKGDCLPAGKAGTTIYFYLAKQINANPR